MALELVGNFPVGQVGQPYFGVITAVGLEGQKIWDVIAVGASGMDPGLRWDGFVATITGTPTKAGTYTFTVRCTIANNTATKTFTIVIQAGTPAPVSLELAYSDQAGNVGTAYTGTLAASNGTAPYVYSASGLPPGTDINKSTGAVTGSPTASGSFDVLFGVTDAAGSTASIRQTILIRESGDPGGGGDNGGGGTGGTGNTGGGLIAPGISINANGLITGQPTTAGTFPFTIRVTDADGNQDTLTCAIVIKAPGSGGGGPGGGSGSGPGNGGPGGPNNCQAKFTLMKVVVTMRPAVHLPVRGKS